LKKIINGEFDLRTINPEKVKIQSKSSIVYTNIVKELKIRNAEFHICKPKQERNFKIILKHMHSEKDVDEIRKDIEELGYTNTNVRNIKKRGTKVPLHMFYVELKPGNNNKDIYEVRFT